MTDTTQIPGANSPQVLTRMLEVVSRGVRTTRGLQEALGVGVQTVRAYVHAAAWLSLVDTTDPVELSPLGLEYVYAGPRRAQVYARAVWSNPVAADLLVGSDGRVPDLDVIEDALGRVESGLADATLRRRASAVRGLIAPAVGRPRPLSREEDERQLGLALEHRAVAEAPPTLPRWVGEHDPEAYRYVLACLLDHGELGVGHLRALLDRAGAPTLGLGGFLDLAVARGDGVRLQDRLIATAGAVARRDLAASTASVMLSDPGYRAYLDELLVPVPDREAAIRRDLLAKRYWPWDRRLFGESARHERLVADLERILVDRPLEAFPVAQVDNRVSLPVSEAFLDAWERPGLRIALPPSFGQLQGGLVAANRILKQARQGAHVALPDLADRPVVVHSGILHPGEPLPKSVPDVRTLRQRVVMHAPYASVVTALLLLHRLAPDRVQVTEDREGWAVRRPGGGRPLLDWVDGFALSRGWLPIRRSGAGLPSRTFVAALEVLGVATVVGRTLVLSESLFGRLQTEAEELEVLGRLQPMCDAIEAHLSGPS
jgi:hypothetical protein